MKTFDQEKDIVYTFRTVEEEIRPSEGNWSIMWPDSLGGPFPPIASEYQSLVTPNSRIKTYSHWVSGALSGGYYQTLYDRSFLDPNATPVYDFTVGSSLSSSYNGTGSVGSKFVKQKNRIYSYFANKLLGSPSAIFVFEQREVHDAAFVCFKRNQTKDGIKTESDKTLTDALGSFGIMDPTIGSTFVCAAIFTGSLSGSSGLVTYENKRGEAILTKFGNIGKIALSDTDRKGNNLVGQLYYEHGIAIFDIAKFSNTGSHASNEWLISASVKSTFQEVIKTSGSNMTINSLFDGVRQRFFYFGFRNNVKVQTTFYTCTAEKEEFNYSSNPSFVNGQGQIITTSGSVSGQPITYITRVGLLGVNNELLAQATLSRPIRKDFNSKIKIKVRLDY